MSNFLKSFYEKNAIDKNGVHKSQRFVITRFVNEEFTRISMMFTFKNLSHEVM